MTDFETALEKGQSLHWKQRLAAIAKLDALERRDADAEELVSLAKNLSPQEKQRLADKLLARKRLETGVISGVAAAAISAGAMFLVAWVRTDCVPGKSDPCGPPTAPGTQVCASDGKSYGPCTSSSVDQPSPVPDANSPLTLSCPATIHSYRQLLHGSASVDGATGYKLALYVGPDDHTNRYWLQAKDIRPRRGQWSQMAHFGEPYELGHVKGLPLTFQVVVASYVGNPDIPGEIVGGVAQVNGNFGAALQAKGFSHVETCSVEREEPGDTCGFRPMPRITNPAPVCCSVDATGNACGTGCSYVDIPTAPGGSVLDWEPRSHAYVTVTQRGEAVAGFPKVEKPPIKLDAHLDAGVYKVQVRETRESDCVSTAWFRVE